MSVVKKWVILSSLCLTELAWSGTMGIDPTVVYQSSGYELAIDALYLQTNLPAFNRPVNIESYVPYLAPYADLPSQWGFGFRLEGAYRFNEVNDFDLNWIHLKNEHNFGFNQTLTGGGIFTGTGSLEPNFNAVNFEFGQRMDYGPLAMRFEGSLQYARLYAARNLQGIYYFQSTNYPVVSYSSGLFQGVGPRGGAKFSFRAPNGFGVMARGDVGFIIGNKKYSQTPNIYGRLNYSGSTYGVVPEIEMNVGGEYAYSLAYGDLSLGVGWMWINYFNAQSYRDIFNTTVSDTREANFGLQGLYFGLRWLG